MERTDELDVALGRYGMLIEHARDLVLFISPETGAILDANRAAERCYQYTLDELRNLTVYDLRPDGRRADVRPRMDEASTTGAVFETLHRRKDGSTFPVEVSSQSGVLAGQRILVSIIRDITERAEHEHFRDLFLGMLGHDLRNPLSAVLIGASMLGRGAGLTADQRQTLDTIQSSAVRMRRMIDQLLDFTRAGLGGGIPLQRAPLDLFRVAERIVQESRQAHPESDIVLDAHGRTTGLWDDDRMQQVFSNLLGNAVEHGARGKVRLWLLGGERALKAGVHNQGEPIDPSELAHVFDPFHRGRALRRSAPSGLGLGLYISRQIVLAHEGDIRVTSSDEGGVTFELTLPYEPARPT